MNIEIKVIEYSDLLSAMQLIEECFDLFVAPDYTLNGIASFKNRFIHNPQFLEKFSSGIEKMYGAYYDNRLVGCLSISINNTVSCVFVKDEYHRKGIASMLFHTVINELRERDEKVIQLNASPYAVSFYHAIGFEDTGGETDYEGIRYTPMKYIIK